MKQTKIMKYLKARYNIKYKGFTTLAQFSLHFAGERLPAAGRACVAWQKPDVAKTLKACKALIFGYLFIKEKVWKTSDKYLWDLAPFSQQTW